MMIKNKMNMQNYALNTSKRLSISAFNFTAMETTIHRGKKLERVLRAEAVNFVDVASRITWKGKRHINRMTLYNWFKDENLDVEKIMAVAKLVPAVAEAFDEIDLKQHLMEKEADYLKTEGTLSIECQKQINYWRDQTITLQRRVMELQDRILDLRTNT